MTLADNAPKLINGYDILDFLGKGGMGIVYRARQISIGRDVALKVLSPKLAQDRVFVSRLMEEARAAARLDHPNIVKAITAGEADGYHYFAMEFVDGKSLAQMLADSGPVDPAQALSITCQIADALEYACERNMVHLDLKPSNILLTSTHIPKLADFGLARRISDIGQFISEKTMVFGTPRYMSPEHLTRQAGLDVRSDIYSLGVTFYEMLTGKSPFREARLVDTVKRVRAGAFEPLDKVLPTVNPDMCAVVHKMMAHSREARYRNAQELLADLAALQKGVSPVYALQQVPGRVSEALPVLTAEEDRGDVRGSWVAWLVVTVIWLIFVALLGGPLVRDALATRFRIRAPSTAKSGGQSPQYAAMISFRRALLTANAFAAEAQYGQAVAELDAFISQRPKEAAPDIEDLKARATARRAEIMKEASEEIRRLRDQTQQAINTGNWPGARDLTARLSSMGLTEAETEARQLLPLIESEETAKKQEQRRQIAQQGLAELTATVKKLVKDREYPRALAVCDAFLAKKEYADLQRSVDALRQPLLMKANLLSATERGAAAMVGKRVESLGGTISTVHDGEITLEKDGATEKVRVQDLEGKTMAELAGAGGVSDAALLHTAVASVLLDASRYDDAYHQAALARESNDQPYASLLDDIEARALFGVAEKSANDGQWQACLDYLKTLAKKNGKSQFYTSHSFEISDLQTGARHEQLLASGLVYVEAGDFFFQGAEKAYIDTFYMDKLEVSVADYDKFLKAVQSLQQSTGQARLPFCNPEEEANKNHTPANWEEQLKSPDLPVVGVDWFNAYAYAGWAGKSLPDEMEWEKAAEGASPRKYPWGDKWDPSKANSVASAELRRQLGGAVSGENVLLKVDSLPDGASPYGCLNMAGNAREWTGARLAGSRTLYLVKGGSFADPPEALTIANRWLVLRTSADMITGFRCCVRTRAAPEPATDEKAAE